MFISKSTVADGLFRMQPDWHLARHENVELLEHETLPLAWHVEDTGLHVSDRTLLCFSLPFMRWSLSSSCCARRSPYGTTCVLSAPLPRGGQSMVTAIVHFILYSMN